MARRVPRGDVGTVGADAIVCAGVTKDYGGGRGVLDLDLRVRRGEVFGFIGPNGAGKTTTIRLLMDLIRPDRGTATVLGMDAHRDRLAVKRRVGYLPASWHSSPASQRLTCSASWRACAAASTPPGSRR
jgi:ABC-type multidrug transport system ATPase subunit